MLFVWFLFKIGLAKQLISSSPSWEHKLAASLTDVISLMVVNGYSLTEYDEHPTVGGESIYKS